MQIKSCAYFATLGLHSLHNPINYVFNNITSNSKKPSIKSPLTMGRLLFSCFSFLF
uniref:Uncharacterized protein n=1 Tax=uncultured marine virus TaxID=186617 RepID=A0A0F7L5F4_9VIRU|nr:hypothetical protein [uncultured marine virus]